MDIILNPDFLQYKNEAQNLQQYLTELILEKDELECHICPNLEADYILKVGALEYKVFELDTAVRELKRKLELIRAKLNRREKVDMDEINRQIKQEYEEYEEKIRIAVNIVLESTERLNGESLSPEESARLKEAYRKIAKQLHPDLNPDATDEEKAIFLRAIEAYKNGNLTELEMLAILVDKAPEKEDASAVETLKQRCEQLRRNVGKLESEIEEIKTSYPYKYKDFLADEEQVSKRQAELNKTIDDLKAAELAYINTIANAIM